jgi:hypothetical protein
MNRIVKWTAAILILVTATSFATAQTSAIKAAEKIASKVAKKIPLTEWAKWTADQADEATRKDSEVIAKTVDRGFREKAQLVSGTTSVEVVVEQTTSYWRGSVKQQLTMPCTATLAIDLDKLLASATFDPVKKTIEVYLPPLSIIAVESHNSKYTADVTYSGGCWKWYDSGTSTALEVSLLKSDWGELARKEIDLNADHLRKATVNETTRFLERLIAPINPGLKIVVNP